jgi:hypothetical protein
MARRLFLPFLLLLLYATRAHAVPPPPDACVLTAGTDVFASYGTATRVANVTVPADFFAPGSLPFSGVVAFHGSDVDEVSVHIRRFEDAVVAPSLAPPVVPIELVQLSLVSVQPILVTYVNGSTQLWDVRVAHVASSNGTMTIRSDERCGCALLGGTFDAVLPVLPLFTFSTVGVENRTQQGAPINATLTAWPWSYKDLSVMNSPPNFYAGLLTQTCDDCLDMMGSPPDFFQTAFVQRAYGAPFAPLAAWFPAVGGDDGDADTVPNAGDNCGVHVNAGQEDADGDGFGDACDPRPAVNESLCTITGVDCDGVTACMNVTDHDTKVAICHSTGADNNPYSSIEVSRGSTLVAHLLGTGGAHMGRTDLISGVNAGFGCDCEACPPPPPPPPPPAFVPPGG